MDQLFLIADSGNRYGPGNGLPAHVLAARRLNSAAWRLNDCSTAVSPVSGCITIVMELSVLMVSHKCQLTLELLDSVPVFHV